MTNALLVVWRESLEAWLIVAMLATWLTAGGEGQRGRIALAGGVFVGIALAGALGWALLDIRDDLTGDALETFQIGALIAAAGMITHMVLWLRHHARDMKTRLQAGLAKAQRRGGLFGVALVAALAVAREGAETVVFLCGLAQGIDLGSMALGAGAGFIAAAATAWLAHRSLARLDIGTVLRLSSLALLVIASAMTVAACDRLIGAGWLPPLIDPLWDSAWLLDDAGAVGKLLADFAGYRARPALTTLAVWSLYWLAVITFWHRPQPRPVPLLRT